MLNNINKKLSSEINLTSKDIINIGKSFNLSSVSSKNIIYKLLKETEDKDSFNKINKLIEEIEIEEPFNGMPDEVKPSLIKLSKIKLDNKDDIKELLNPIINNLNHYVELKSEQEKIKKKANIAYIITIVSFIIGASSFYFTLNSPTAKDIAKEIEIINSATNIKK
ncbi:MULTISPECIES: hypothetical protein [Aliarcobacter]|nr:hypothetical protein [Aliarcobacter skirrowii]